MQPRSLSWKIAKLEIKGSCTAHFTHFLHVQKTIPDVTADAAYVVAHAHFFRLSEVQQWTSLEGSESLDP